jgi:hypothetical protein
MRTHPEMKGNTLDGFFVTAYKITNQNINK